MLLIRLLLPQQLVPVSPSEEILMMKRKDQILSNNMLSFSSIPNNQVWGPSISENYFRAIVVLVCWISSQDLRVDLHIFALTA